MIRHDIDLLHSMNVQFDDSRITVVRRQAKKGAGRFLLDRLVKLGIPYAVFSFLVSPLLVMAVRAHAGKPAHFGPYFDSGPPWFIEALFIFTLVFMGIEAVRKARRKAPRLGSPPSTRAIFLYIVCAAALGFAVRILFPVGWSLHNLPLGYFPMYVILFAVGIAAGRGNWLERIPQMKLGLWLPWPSLPQWHSHRFWCLAAPRRTAERGVRRLGGPGRYRVAHHDLRAPKAGHRPPRFPTRP